MVNILLIILKIVSSDACLKLIDGLTDNVVKKKDNEMKEDDANVIKEVTKRHKKKQE